ncbi:MAG TPA: ankyrin repeat domain-containing protein [Pyrinomonadaceae bacterium]|nr:ankyrin repeat domain-containing protein [Pyrinomonadaceae bacterium]
MSSSIPLTQAVTSGDERAVRTLLAEGADVNESTGGGRTALILAVIFGHTNLVRILVNAGADPHLRDNLGLNAIEWAKRRGLSEALAILTHNPTANILITRPTVETEKEAAAVEPPRPAAPPPQSEKRESDADEKSRRWLAGLKQRLDEIEGRRLNRNEPPRQSRQLDSEAPPPTPVEVNKPPVTEAFVAPKPSVREPQAPEPPVPKPPAREPRVPEQIVTNRPAIGRIITPPPEPVSTSSGKRKRCPKCNAIYNSDLVSYCAHHIVPLVDADEPIIAEPARGKNPPMFWIMVVITLTGSIVVGSLVTTYLYTSRQTAARNAAAQQKTIQKGLPELSAELNGKAVSLPEAQCPVSGPTPVSGAVTVHVMVDKKGQVYWARGAGGDWLMRGAATEAAMKSTFSPEKLRGREAEGTITYTFKP